MPLVISDQTVNLHLEEITHHTTTDTDGKELNHTKLNILETVHLVSGVQKVVPTWVLDHEHFKTLEAEGKASSIA
jgi:hypothetical protein